MSVSILIGRQDHHSILQLAGELRGPCAPLLEKALHLLISAHRPIVVDLNNAQLLDSTVLGLLAGKLFPHKQTTTLLATTPGILKQLSAMNFDNIFTLEESSLSPGAILTPIEVDGKQDKEQIRDYVKSAHEELIKIDKQNEKDYRRVIDCLNKKDS